MIARKMREGLVKAAAIGGLPKVRAAIRKLSENQQGLIYVFLQAINSLLALKNVTPSALVDEPLHYSPTSRSVEVYDIPSSTILHRGQTFFGQVRHEQPRQ